MLKSNFIFYLQNILFDIPLFFFFGQVMRFPKRVRTHMKSIFKPYYIQTSLHSSRMDHNSGKALPYNATAFPQLKLKTFVKL